VIWLLPAALCSISIAAILKVNERRAGDRLVLAGANYLVAAGLSLLLLRGASGSISGRTLALGAVTGADYVLGFLILMAGIGRGPLAVPVTVMRLSVAVPVVVSIFLWNEAPRPLQWGGLAAGLLAIVLFGLGIGGRGSGSRARAGFFPLMAAMFAVMGLGDVLLKAFRETSPDSERLLFTLVLFGSAGLLTWLMILAGGRRLRRGTVLLGLLLGVPNLLSTVFTLLALRTVPASIAFPFINLTVIFGSTLIGRAVWKESLSRTATAGLAAAALALILLRF
jgi:drug/metabolite transporter (DMT)-like permease